MAHEIDRSGTILLKKEVQDYLKQSFPEDDAHFERLLEVLTTCPLFTTLRVKKGHADELLVTLREELNKQCKTLQWEVFEPFIHPTLNDCILVRNRGPYDLEKPSKEIVVDVHCGMAVTRGAHVFKQGIMAAPHGMRQGDKVAVYSDLDGKCLKGTAAEYLGRKVHVGTGISQVSREELFNSKEIQTGVGILMTEPLYQAPSLADLDTTQFFPQNLPSMVCGHLLDPQPGETILDMCAAPGGKTTHIASLMEGRGRLVALEKSAQRVSRMREMFQKISPSPNDIYTFDSTKAVSLEGDACGGPPYPPAMFDRILLDAPCSALGQRPCLANLVSINQLKSYPTLQRKLLAVAVQLLKPGGVLVYSTCTLPKEENEDQVWSLLKTYPEMELVESPFAASSGGLECSQLTPEERSKVMRFDPTNMTAKMDDWDRDTICFFIAKFRKKDDKEMS